MPKLKGLIFRIILLMKVKKKHVFTGVYCLLALMVASMVHSWHYMDLTSHDLKTKPLLKNYENDFPGLVHVLGEGCGCSHFTAEYLIKRGPQENLNEFVYYFSTAKDFTNKDDLNYLSELKKKGFRVIHKALSEPKNDIQLYGVPFFQFFSNKGDLLYSGGYSKQMITRTTTFYDLKIVQNLVDKKHGDQLPVFGCVTGRSFQRKIDPLGLKY